MAIIQTPTEETASAEIRPIFDAVKELVGFVPKPTQLLGTSPGVLQPWWQTMQHFQQNTEFSRSFLTHVRMLVATHNEFPFCIEFNTAALKMLGGMTDEEVAVIRQDPSQAALPEAERDLLLFVLRAVAEPEEVTAEEVAALRDRGWSDQAIFEATYYGAWMVLVGMLFNTFKMHEE